MSRIESFYEVNLGLALAIGMDTRFSGKTIEAYNAAIATSKEDLWTQSGLQTWIPTAAPIHISSSSSADQDIEVTVEYLDLLWQPQTAVVFTDDTDGQTEIITSITAIRINKAWVSGGSAAVGKIYLYEDDTVTLGVPQTATLIHAVLEIADQETKHGWWSIPDGYEGYVLDWQVDTLAAIVMTNKVEVREFNGVFLSKDTLIINAGSKGKTKVIAIKCPPKSDVKITSVGASGSSLVNGELTLVLRKL